MVEVAIDAAAAAVGRVENLSAKSRSNEQKIAVSSSPRHGVQCMQIEQRIRIRDLLKSGGIPEVGWVLNLAIVGDSRSRWLNMFPWSP